jgi:glutamyl-tRNA reductase
VLYCLSASHKTAEFATLERLSATVEITPPRLVGAHRNVRGAVIVATCNRFEAYLDLEPDADGSCLSPVAAVVETIAEAAGMAPRELRDSLAFRHDTVAVQHLFAVASGLESVVVGEDEIAGQVRRALEHAQREGAASSELETLFQRALEASRLVKNSSGIDAEGRSIVGVALDMASSRIRDWRETRVLLVGTGRYAAAALAAVRARGVRDVRAYSVSNGGVRFAERHDLALVPRADFAREAALADVIVSCTTARHYVLDAATLLAGRAKLPASGRRLRLTTSERAVPASSLVIDLGLPRNINPDVAGLEGVSVVDLETIRIHAAVDDLATMGDAQAIVSDATQRFSAAARVREVAPGLAALRKHVLDLLDAELARAQKRTGHSKATEEALRHFAGVVLHQPMTRSRILADQGQATAWIEGLSALFGIEAIQGPAGDAAAEESRVDPNDEPQPKSQQASA